LKFYITLIIQVLLFTLISLSNQLEMELIWSKESTPLKYLSADKSSNNDFLYLLKGKEVGMKPSRIDIWNMKSKQMHKKFEVPQGLSYLTSNNSGTILLGTYFMSPEIVVIDPNKGEIIRVDRVHFTGTYVGLLKPVFLSDEDKYAVYEYNNKMVFINEIQTGNNLKLYDVPNIDGHVVFSGDGSYFAYCTKDKKVIIRSLASGAEMSSFAVPEKPFSMDFVSINYLAISFNFQGANAHIRWYDGFSGQLQFSLETNSTHWYVKFSGDMGNVFFASALTNKLGVYNIAMKQTKYFDPDFDAPTLTTDLNSDKCYIVDKNGNLAIFSGEKAYIVDFIDVSNPEQHSIVTNAKLTPDRNYIITTGNLGDIIFHDILTGNYVTHIKTGLNSITSLDISENSEKILVTDSNGKSMIFNITKINEYHVVREYAKDNYTITRFLNNDEFIACGKYAGLIIVTENGFTNIMPDGKYYTPTDLAISPDKNKIIMATYENKLVVFKRDQNQQFSYETEFYGDSSGISRGGISSVRFSNDGNYIINSTSEYKSRIWDSHDYKFERSYYAESGHRSAQVSSAILSADGEFVFQCDAIPTLRVFHRPNSFLLDSKLNLMPNALIRLGYMDLSKDGNLLLLVSGNGTFFLWDIYGNLSNIPNSNGASPIHPNPATDYIYININNFEGNSSPYNSKFGDVKIFNTLGQCMITTPSLRDTSSEKGNLKIDVSHLLPGVYFVRYGSRAEKFVKW